MSGRYVWVESWQLQCCGTTFSIDDRVSWTTVPVTDSSDWPFLEPGVAASITDYEEHHSDEPGKLTRLSGLVRSINAVFCEFHVEDRFAAPVPGSGVLQPRAWADGWEKDADWGDGLSFVGYLVEVGDDSPATKSGMTRHDGRRALLRR